MTTKKAGKKGIFDSMATGEELTDANIVADKKPAKNNDKKKPKPKKHTIDESPTVDNPAQTPDKLLKGASIKFFLTPAEKERATTFANNKLSPDSTASEVCRSALAAYLDKQEPILEDMETFIKNKK